MIKEEWKDIKEYEGIYQISNLGRLKNVKTNTFKTASLNKNGYLYADLWKNNKCKKKTLHRLVAETFLTNDLRYTDVNHIDGNKQNNAVSNLEFCNRSHNLKEAYKLELRKVVRPMLGRKNTLCPTSKKVNQFDKNGNFIKQWGSTMEIERQLNICHANISSCCKNKYKTAGGYKWRYVE